MKLWRSYTWGVCAILLAACALGEGPSPTPPPPLTVPAAPTLTFTGDCSVNRDLANWLQFTEYQLGEFTTLVSAMPTQDSAEFRESMLTLATMRQAVSQTAAPDCAEPAHRMVITNMNRAIEGFQARANGEDIDITGLVAEVLGQFDLIVVEYGMLNERLTTQLEERTTSDG